LAFCGKVFAQSKRVASRNVAAGDRDQTYETARRARLWTPGPKVVTYTRWQNECHYTAEGRSGDDPLQLLTSKKRKAFALGGVCGRSPLWDKSVSRRLHGCRNTRLAPIWFGSDEYPAIVGLAHAAKLEGGQQVVTDTHVSEYDMLT